VITLRKLQSLGKKTMLRKSVLILQQVDAAYGSAKAVNEEYLRGLVGLIREASREDGRVSAACRELEELLSTEQRGEKPKRAVNTLRYVLQEYLGVSSGDWDFYEPGTARLDVSRRKVRPLRVYLDDIRSPFNVGSIFRTADCFGVEKILVSPYTASPSHPRSVRTSMGCTDSVPWEEKCPEHLEEEPGVFALELGGLPLDRFDFPPRGIVIIGSEELGVSPEALAVADGSLGRVSVPLYGTKGSLNVSVAFGILMHAWRSALEGGDA